MKHVCSVCIVLMIHLIVILEIFYHIFCSEQIKTCYFNNKTVLNRSFLIAFVVVLLGCIITFALKCGRLCFDRRVFIYLFVCVLFAELKKY